MRVLSLDPVQVEVAPCGVPRGGVCEKCLLRVCPMPPGGVGLRPGVGGQGGGPGGRLWGQGRGPGGGIGPWGAPGPEWAAPSSPRQDLCPDRLRGDQGGLDHANPALHGAGALGGA